MMRPIHTYKVVPSLPPQLERLQQLAYNLRWAWDHATIELFRRLDGELWQRTYHNPVRMLTMIDQSQLEAAATDEAFLAHLESVYLNFETHMAGMSTWFKKNHHENSNLLVAYFSAEFGITECLSIFAGGLGMLAGDHLKSASDLGVPLVGVGLLYQQGYFTQYLSEAGWQQERYEDNEFNALPLTLERSADGRPVIVRVEFPGRKVAAQIWRAQVGRVNLYLLDTNIEENQPPDRDITDQLYGGDIDMRIRQEIMLGIGGYRALEALNIRPTVYHMNEGHSAFLSLERVRRLVEEHHLTFHEAREAASSSLVFTTHTAVPAGHDYFHPELMHRHFSEYARTVNLPWPAFLGLGRQNPTDEREFFCMTVLSLRMAAYSNAVSRLHGEVTRTMWRGLWPDVPAPEIPIGHVTNGVHFRSWISGEMSHLYDQYLGPRWREEPVDQTVWKRARHVPPEELWRTHERRRERLVAFVRGRLVEQLRHRSAPEAEVEAAQEVLDSKALTIGFARRFATYKRATMILRNPERLARILNNPDCPVQIVFAGKAHPRDDAGKELIRQIVNLARQPQFRRRLVFLENYDAATARYLVQGVDVWLNTPRRPGEASGTSGMKAAANSVLNLSSSDGWWDEVQARHDPEAPPIGWTIGRGELYTNFDYQDQLEAEALYELLERDVVPTFYDRNVDGLPRRWVTRVKNSMDALCHFFNTHRMVKDYLERFYLPADASFAKLSAGGYADAKALADWRVRITQAWPQIKIQAVTNGGEQARVGEAIKAKAKVYLGPLRPEDVDVQLCYGPVNPRGDLTDGECRGMRLVHTETGGVFVYEGEAIAGSTSGLQGYAIRVLPSHKNLPTKFLPGLIVWAG